MYWFVVLLILPFISTEDVTLKHIFQETKSSIDSNSTERMMEVLTNYYFTTVKEKSIWYRAQKEANDIFGMDLDMESLQFIETLLKRLASHYHHCVTLLPGLERAQCFSDSSAMLKDTEKGARWHTDPDMEVGEKTKWGTLYNSVAAMSALVSVISNNNLKQFTNPTERKEKIHRFTHVIYKMISDMQGSNEYDHDVVEFRLDQISPVNICEMKTHFWKEFEGSCETRWTTMAFDKSHKNQIKLRSNISSPQKPATAGGKTAEETEATIPDNDESRNTVEDKGIDAAMLIGGDLGPMRKRYRAYIVDSSNDKTIFEKYFTADVGSRGDAMDAATKEGLEKRGKEELKVKDDIMAFINGTFYINMKLLRTTLQLLNV